MTASRPERRTQGVYLDHNATTPVRPEVMAAIAEALEEGGNPSSVHQAGRRARRRTEEARQAVAFLVGAEPEEIVFTSGGTEANNLAIKGQPARRLLVAAVEHDSVLRAAPAAKLLPVREQGELDLGALESALAQPGAPALVCVQLANNETGVLQSISEIARLVHRQGGLLHCDAVQAAGKVPISMAELGCDTLTLSAHKLGGPPGVGALVVRGDLRLTPLIAGGGQEGSRRAGTENLPGIAGLGRAAQIAMTALPAAAALVQLRDSLERRALALTPAARVAGAAAPRLPNTSCLALPGISAEVQVIALDLAGVMVSAGAACSSGKVRASHVLAAMGVESELARAAIRVSLGWTSRASDIEAFLQAWEALARRAEAFAAP
jgi:cysteine desulfurase